MLPIHSPEVRTGRSVPVWGGWKDISALADMAVQVSIYCSASLKSGDRGAPVQKVYIHHTGKAVL